MLVNQIINVSEDFGSGDITEPVTLPQVKNYLRLGGFTSDDSGEQEFDFDDDLLTALITEARMWVEKFTGQYLVPRTLTVVLLNQAGGMELPGPVDGTIAYTNPTGDNIGDSLTVLAGKYPRIVTQWNEAYGYNIRVVSRSGCSPQDDYITATYDVGYEDYPAWAQNAVMAYVAFAYEHRGDEDLPGSPIRAAAIARAHRRVNPWA